MGHEDLSILLRYLYIPDYIHFMQLYWRLKVYNIHAQAPARIAAPPNKADAATIKARWTFCPVHFCTREMVSVSLGAFASSLAFDSSVLTVGIMTRIVYGTIEGARMAAER